MKVDLKSKILEIKSTVKDAFNKKIAHRDIKKDQSQSQTDFSKKVDPLVRDKGLEGSEQKEAS